MAIVLTLNLDHFKQQFKDKGCDTFSSLGYRKLFDALTELSEDSGEPVEMDAVSIATDWTEYDDLDDVLAAYPNAGLEDNGQERTEKYILDDLGWQTDVYALENGHYLIRDF